MQMKPTQQEEEYFVRLEFERRRKVLEERETQAAEEERRRILAVAPGRCPKCAGALVPVPIGASSWTSARAARGCGWTSASSIRWWPRTLAFSAASGGSSLDRKVRHVWGRASRRLAAVLRRRQR